MRKFLAALALAGLPLLSAGIAHADVALDPLCWFGTTGAVAPCGQGYGNGNGQLTPAQQVHQCQLLAQEPPADQPNWYVSACGGA